MTPVASQRSEVAVVVLNWNGLSHLQTYLPPLLAGTTEDIAIWVADNGSTDESMAWLASNHSDRVQLLPMAVNHGFAEGYNRALQEIDADTYVLLNSDVRVTPGWMDIVLQEMKVHGWSAASPLIVQDDDPRRCEHAGAAGGWMDGDGYPFCLGRIFGATEPVDGWHRQSRDVFWASGACFFIHKEAWQEADGFDGDLFAHMEEIDLCWRLQDLGHRIGCAGNATVQHLGGGTLQASSPFKTYLNFRNNLIVMLKNRQGWWPVFMFRRMTLDGMAAFRMLGSGDWRQFLAVGKAHGGLYLALPRVLKQRRALQKLRVRRGPLKGWWSGSIVWSHFIGGVQRARDLKGLD